MTPTFHVQLLGAAFSHFPSQASVLQSWLLTRRARECLGVSFTTALLKVIIPDSP